MRIDGRIKCKNDQNFKKQSQLFLLPPKWVGRGVLLPILKTHESTTNPPNSVNNAQDLMSIKFKSLFRNKLHPSVQDLGWVIIFIVKEIVLRLVRSLDLALCHWHKYSIFGRIYLPLECPKKWLEWVIENGSCAVIWFWKLLWVIHLFFSRSPLGMLIIIQHLNNNVQAMSALINHESKYKK